MRRESALCKDQRHRDKKSQKSLHCRDLLLVISLVGRPTYNSHMALNNRRDFLRGSVTLASSGLMASSASSYEQVAGSNEKINLGVIGVGSRGSSVMSNFQN